MKQQLLGIVGSRAYGLSNDNSDVDRIGIHTIEPLDFCGLYSPNNLTVNKVVSGGDDLCSHELSKACSLLLKCNPTVTEALWLPYYDVLEPCGYDLIAIRQAFLSAGKIKNSYLGYAYNQVLRMERSTPAGSSKNRKNKHARHVIRLLIQFKNAWDTGEISIRLSPNEIDDVFYHSEALVNSGNTQPTIKYINDLHNLSESQTPLPSKPNVKLVEDVIRKQRINDFKKTIVSDYQ